MFQILLGKESSTYVANVKKENRSIKSKRVVDVNTDKELQKFHEEKVLL